MSLAVLCPGQGGQHAGMFDLIASVAEGEAALRRAGDLVGFDLRGEGDRIFDNAVAQPTLCAVALATWSLLAPRLAAAGIAPACFAGYSVGELAAHGCAGALSFDDTIVLAQVRARAMDAASTDGDGLVAVRGLALAQVDALAALHGGHVAIVNGEDQVLVGGTRLALDALVADVARRHGQTQRLPVRVASHTPSLARAVEPFRARLAAVTWRGASAPVLAGIDGSKVSDAPTAIDVLARQVATTIRWSACMDAVQERGTTVCLELGPGRALSRMMQERHRDIASRSIEDFRSIDGVVEWVVRASA